MPPSSDFSVAPGREDFCPDLAVPARSIFSSESDYDLFVASDFRADLTVPPDPSAVPDTWPACR